MAPTPHVSETLRSFGVTEDAKSWLQCVKGIRNHSSKEKREELYSEGIQAFEARQECRKSGNELIARIEGSPAPRETEQPPDKNSSIHGRSLGVIFRNQKSYSSTQSLSSQRRRKKALFDAHRSEKERDQRFDA
ncbi:hypothetical protein LX32DRAFT_687126 [Colletotrichum zoysiae]|uniref:Uncharacterized protein n=1 Tax=Colletotrichum zoysiae TaxID=1216348 RepID=A0AAD9LY81_9PEZI|nr:hypothetical protein LX32DRAFT_687126 [Colletotrichum zoysiae]